MAVDSETSSPRKISKPADSLVCKSSPAAQDPSEDMEEDELQMESGETIDDSSLKLNITELDESKDQDKPQDKDRSRCSSRSRSRSCNSSGSGSDQERSPVPLNQLKVEAEAKPLVNSIQVANVGPLRKLKVRRNNTELQGEDETKTDVGNGPSKRRKWGTSQLLPVKKPALVISTDSLKSIIPDARPLTVEEVRLGSPNAVPKELRKPSTVSHAEDEAPVERVEKVEQPSRRIPIEVSGEGIGPVKPELVLAATAPLLEATSPAQQPRASVLHVSNLVRPFTINQLKDLLVRTGNLVEGKFWIDKVKSSCLVQFETEEEAEETRAALHGIHWPTSNPKTLVVDYSTVENLENRLSGKELSAPQNSKTDASLRPSGAVQSNQLRLDKAERVREWDQGKVGDGSTSPAADTSLPEDKSKSAKDETPAKLLDDLFRKTKTSPCIYWLPLTAQQIAEKQNMRRQRQLDRDQRISDFQTKKDQELQQRQSERERQRENDRHRQRERQRSRKRSRSSSSSSSSSADSTNNKRRTSKMPPRKR
uniref:EOG090X0F73 n=1 Tax=Evadne anonyx TaxID=141404 RepID=A0A9N6WQK7_9CRUS|nr:EOG090X0F73 [Evadne anonyx]